MRYKRLEIGVILADISGIFQRITERMTERERLEPIVITSNLIGIKTY